jgi:hypothetical protein
MIYCIVSNLYKNAVNKEFLAMACTLIYMSFNKADFTIALIGVVKYVTRLTLHELTVC